MYDNAGAAESSLCRGKRTKPPKRLSLAFSLRFVSFRVRTESWSKGTKARNEADQPASQRDDTPSETEEGKTGTASDRFLGERGSLLVTGSAAGRARNTPISPIPS